MASIQYSRLSPCRNCHREVRLVRDTTSTAQNWLCPSCGHRTPASQNEAFVSDEYAVGDQDSNGTQVGAWSLATPDLGGYESVLKP